MSKKKILVTIAAAFMIVAVLGTTVALAADDETEFGRGFRRWSEDGERAPYNEERTPYSQEWISQLVEDDVITQEQADSIMSGDARLFDFVNPEDCEEYGMFGENGMFGRAEAPGQRYNEEHLAQLVEEGVITQEQADSILAGDARLFDFADPEDCLTEGEGRAERGMSKAPRGGRRALPSENP